MLKHLMGNFRSPLYCGVTAQQELHCERDLSCPAGHPSPYTAIPPPSVKVRRLAADAIVRPENTYMLA